MSLQEKMRSFRSNTDSMKTKHESHNFNLQKERNDSYNKIITIELCQKTFVSSYLKKPVPFDEHLFIFKIDCCVKLSSFSWTICKTDSDIREFLLQLLSTSYEVAKKQLENIKELLAYSDIKSSLLLLLLDSFCSTIKISKFLEFMEFLELSQVTLDSIEKGFKPKEGYIKKKTFVKYAKCSQCVSSILSFFKYDQYEKKWFILHEDYLCYLDSSKDRVGRQIFWLDQEFNVYQEDEYTIKVVDGFKKIVLKVRLCLKL